MDILGEILKQVLEGATQGQQPQRAPQPQQRAPQPPPQQRAPQGGPQGMPSPNDLTDILTQIDALLAEAGTTKGALLSVTVVLADIADAPAMNRAWDRWLDPAHKPARMTIQAALVNPSWRVEITGVALAP
jgi:enamine deaminase RidA (YjgF/YER057c/UK114 family)